MGRLEDVSQSIVPRRRKSTQAPRSRIVEREYLMSETVNTANDDGTEGGCVYLGLV